MAAYNKPVPRVMELPGSISGRSHRLVGHIGTVQVALSRCYPVNGGGVTTSQLDLPSLTPLRVAGWSRLQLVVANWATSVALLKVNATFEYK